VRRDALPHIDEAGARALVEDLVALSPLNCSSVMVASPRAFQCFVAWKISLSCRYSGRSDSISASSGCSSSEA
jgi:hypothetical protein